MASALKKTMPQMENRPEPKICPKCNNPMEARWRTNLETKKMYWGFFPCGICREKDINDNRARARERGRQRKIDELTLDRGIPAKYREMTFDKFITDPSKVDSKHLSNHATEHWDKMKRLVKFAKQWVEDWEDGSGQSLVFTGQPGNGKTMTACMILLGIIHRHLPRDLLMINATQMFLSIKATYGGNDSLAETNRLKYLAEVPILVVDEVGLQSGSAWEFEKLSYIIHERINNLKSSIYITNNDGSRWREELGDRITDRFNDPNDFAHIAFAWPSWRSGTIYRAKD